jgi:hypothetical protein
VEDDGRSARCADWVTDKDGEQRARLAAWSGLQIAERRRGDFFTRRVREIDEELLPYMEAELRMIDMLSKESTRARNASTPRPSAAAERHETQRRASAAIRNSAARVHPMRSSHTFGSCSGCATLVANGSRQLADKCSREGECFL